MSGAIRKSGREPFASWGTVNESDHRTLYARGSGPDHFADRGVNPIARADAGGMGLAVKLEWTDFVWIWKTAVGLACFVFFRLRKQVPPSFAEWVRSGSRTGGERFASSFFRSKFIRVVLGRSLQKILEPVSFAFCGRRAFFYLW